MSPEEQNILKREIRQVKVFLAKLEIQNQIINEQLALLLLIVGKVRASYLETDRLITEFEEKLKK